MNPSKAPPPALRTAIVPARRPAAGRALRAAIAPALFLAAILPSRPVLADEPPTKADRDEAQRRYQRGKELYEENDFAAALVEIRRAHSLSRSYKLLYDIGQICYQMQDYPCALRSFTTYLAEGKDEVTGQRRTDVQADIDRLKGRVATLRISTSLPGAEILIDDVAQGTTPLAAGVLVSAGRRKVTARIEGSAPVTKIVEIAGGDSTDVMIDLGAAPAASSSTTPPSTTAATPVEAPPGGRKVPVLPWVLTGVFAVGAGVTGGLALAASSDYKTKLDTFGTSRDELDGAGGTMRALAVTSDVLWGATAIAGVTAIVLTITAGPAPAKAAQVSAGPGGIWVRGTF